MIEITERTVVWHGQCKGCGLVYLTGEDAQTHYIAFGLRHVNGRENRIIKWIRIALSRYP